MSDLRRNSAGQLKKTAVRRDGWTKKRRAQFLDHLAATCNVRAAVRAADMGERSARALKARDPEFARLWAEALHDGYERLEEELIARAFEQERSGDNPTADERGELPPVTLDQKKIIELLDRRGAERRATGNSRRDRQFRRITQEETDAALLRKLAAVERRLRATGEIE